MESIEKLRMWSHRYDNGWVQEDGSIVIATSTNGVYYGENYGDAIRKMIDAVEREVDEKYMPLPLDADGVPIRLGDELESAYGGKVIVEYVGECEVRVYRDGEHYRISQDEYAYTCRHVKERTVEDVLGEFARVGIRIGSKDGIEAGKFTFYPDEDMVAEYADELRGMMGGDAEGPSCRQ